MLCTDLLGGTHGAAGQRAPPNCEVEIGLPLAENFLFGCSGVMSEAMLSFGWRKNYLFSARSISESTISTVSSPVLLSIRPKNNKDIDMRSLKVIMLNISGVEHGLWLGQKVHTYEIMAQREADVVTGDIIRWRAMPCQAT